MKIRPLALALLLPSLAFAQPVPCVDGFAGEFPCHNVDLLAQPTGGSASDVWGWTDPVTGVEYAITFISYYVRIFDLSDPTAPVEIVRLSDTQAQDARVYADHLYAVGDLGDYMMVFDLARLREIEDPPVVLEADAAYSEISRGHNISLDPSSGFAFVVALSSDVCSGALHIVDVRVPSSPTFAGCFSPPDIPSFHDAHCITYDGPDGDYTGREVCFGSAQGPGTLAIVDVTDKSEPVLIAETPYPNAAYTHQGWLTEDGRYFLLNDEGDEYVHGFNTRTVVFDVEDLDEPEFVFEHFAETRSTSHNLFVVGENVYQANYTAGLRVLDLSGIDNGELSEIAYFDTYPEDDEVGLIGAWGVYPYFESGIVVVSDRERGLFVLQPRLGGTTETAAAPESRFALAAYPNPFAERTTVTLHVEATQRVRVAVYDVLGREVAVLHDGLLGAGEEHTLALDGAGLPAGAYFVRARGETFEAAQPVTLVR